jgi:hypothetical protein
MTPFYAIYRHEKAKVWHEPDGDARFRLAQFYDHAKKIHCGNGGMETCPVCGDLRVPGMVNELSGKKQRINNFLKILLNPAVHQLWFMQSNLIEELQSI